MPPQLQELLQNRNAMIGIAVGVVLIIALAIGIPMMTGGGGPKDPGDDPVSQEQRLLLEQAPRGKVLEIQAILARQGLRTDTTPGTGGTLNLFLMDKATLNDRDQAIITMVESGLMDWNTGLEVFDQSNLMESREEKRIKLIRAQQGELARIIRKINPIEDASVRLSIPEPSIFKKDQKPMTVSVQVTIPPGERLTRDKVRAIINLVVGSIQGLEASNVALSDTNGNTYNSVLDTGLEMQDKMEEQDRYMKEKVSAQLDKLVGPGKYVVTVSTSLREAPKETLVQSYDPSRSAMSSKQRFSETLKSGSSGRDTGGPVSTILPPGIEDLTTDNMDTVESSKGYLRDGVEMTYENGKTQWVETSLPGMIEDISIAVTIDTENYPNIPAGEFQALLARAASPKVNPANVSLARADFQNLGAADITSATAPLPEAGNPILTWLPWMIFSSVGALVIFAMLASMRKARFSEEQLSETTQEIEALRQTAQQQQALLQEQQRQAMLLQQQQQQQALSAQQALEQVRLQDTSQLQATLQELRAALTDKSAQLGPDGLEAPVKQWIESR